jgi:hypothetical protein
MPAAPPAAGATEQRPWQHQQGNDNYPDVRLGWDLVLHPAKLQHAYWQDQAKKWMLWDLQVS